MTARSRRGSALPGGACGWADLARALEAGGPALMADMAQVLGLERRPTAANKPTRDPPESVGQTAPETTPPPPDALEEPPLSAPRLWRLVGVEHSGLAGTEEPRPAPPPPDLSLPTWEELGRPTLAVFQPLSPWRELLPRLRRELAPRMEGQALDVPAIVRGLSRGEHLHRLPRRSYPHWGGQLDLIEDRSNRLTPCWADQALVRARLQRLLPRRGFRRALVNDLHREPWLVHPPEARRSGYPLPPAGSLVLVLGDLGCLALDGGAALEQWLRLGHRLREAGIRPTALLPQAIGRCPLELTRCWQLLNWERNRSEADPRTIEEQLDRLLRLLACTSRVEPGLLRDLRRLANLDAALEAELWQRAVVSPSSVAATLDKDLLEPQRRRFGTDPLRDQALARIRAWRAGAPIEVYLAELALLDERAWDALAEQPDREPDLQAVQRLISALGSRLQGQGEPIPAGVKAWFRRLGDRAGAERSSAFWHDPALHRLWGLLHADDPLAHPPPGYRPQPDWTSQKPVVGLQIYQRDNGLEILTAEEEAPGERGDIPLASLETRTHEIVVEEQLAPGPNAFWKTGSPPGWAEAWGVDEYGRWVSFAVEAEGGGTVRQRLRWIEAGRFLMGSPVSEAGRYDDEGPQHGVTFAVGYWLFDTACTQQLWAAVMGKNPSRFQGPERPVERVSWENAQAFIQRLNERLPGLDLRLPSESEWEQACRAGTTTPFSFGENITPKQVNYDGNFPYADAKKGRYRGETVPVASLPANPWGLYEMHGNVWEWIQDHWHRRYDGAPTDGGGWEETDTDAGASRVVRGGSWRVSARGVRSAFRDQYAQGVRDHALGFRCARGQTGAEPADPAAGRQAERPLRTQRLLIRTNRVPESLECPPWASAIGRDRFGIWSELQVEGAEDRVIQRLRWIEPGRFEMGSPDDEPGRFDREGPQHEVTLSRGYWLFDTPCTQALWAAVMRKNPSRFRSADRPVERVSWDDAQQFLARINDRFTGLDLILPSEAQWEYACRAGTTTATYAGPIEILGTNNAPILDAIAWYGGNSGVDFDLKQGYDSSWFSEKQHPHSKAGTRRVKLKSPNPWGLYDMLGNVREWCLDGRRTYAPETVVDPLGPTEAGTDRVVRGGSWRINARHVRAAFRFRHVPGYRLDNLGFRCARAQAAGEPASPAAEWPVGPDSSGPDPSRPSNGDSVRINPEPQAHRLIIRSDRESLTLAQAARPAWASGQGRDRYGLWSELSVEAKAGPPVIQRLRWIPPGRFQMGSPADEPGRYDDEGPQHAVTLSEGYWLFDTPCTQALWVAVMGENPSRFQSPDRPVERVSWGDAQQFLAKLNDRYAGLDLILPSEAQWEYACRAGTTTATYAGPIEILGESNAPILDEIAWYGGNSGVEFDLEEGTESANWPEKQYAHQKAGTRQVKLKRPNPWGLYDMLGNVWEWTQDHWHDDYAGAPAEGGPSEDADAEAGASRMVRGGSWLSYARRVRAAYRVKYAPDSRYESLGFRCARGQA